MSNTEKNHNYGIDLLRIIAMLIIVAHHFSLHSGIPVDTGSSDDMLMHIMALGGKTGVNIFVLITGFCSTGKIRKEKILGLIGNTTFYSLVLTCFAVVLGITPLSKKLLLKALFPWLLGGNYWFIVTYLELYLLTPVLYKVAQALDIRSYEKYLGLFTLLLCIAPTVIGKFIEVNDFGYNALIWFVYLYFLGAYLKRRIACGIVGRYIYIYIAALLLLVQIAACVAVQNGVSNEFLHLLLKCISDYSLNAAFPLMISVAMLLGFLQLRLSHGAKLLQAVGAATLGVYLFHDNGNFRIWLWPTVYQLISSIGLDLFAVNALLTVLFVFILGSSIEICRTAIVHEVRNLIQDKRK